MKFLKKNELVEIVYNDGIVELKSKVPMKDDYGTPLPGKYTYQTKTKSWFRTLGITSQEVIDAKTVDQELTKKIGIPGNQEIDTSWRAFIGEKQFELFRCFYNYKNDETEISLVEVEVF